jgi:hypothetical protein
MLDLANDRWPDDPDECLLFELPFVARVQGKLLQGAKCIRHYHDKDGWWSKTEDGRSPVSLPKCVRPHE